MKKMLAVALLFVAGSAIAATEDYYVSIKDAVIQNTRTGGTAKISIVVGNNGNIGDEHYAVWAAGTRGSTAIPLHLCGKSPIQYIAPGTVKPVLEIDFEWSN